MFFVEYNQSDKSGAKANREPDEQSHLGLHCVRHRHQTPLAGYVMHGVLL